MGVIVNHFIFYHADKRFAMPFSHACLADCPNQISVCDAGSVWVTALCSCIPSSLLAKEEFVNIVYRDRQCPGGTMTNATHLERLRFCTTIVGNLELVNLSTTDYSALHFIKTITGKPATEIDS